MDGIFYAGTVTAPKNIGETLNEADAAAEALTAYYVEGIVMAAINFGYAINKPRVIDIDRNNLRKSDEILREMPELQTCIGCGGLHGDLYGRQPYGFQLPQAPYARAPGRISGRLRGDEQMHVVRQMPPGVSAWNQYARPW